MLGSSLATVARYRTATLYLERFAGATHTHSAAAVRADAFLQYLRSVEVTPNGHANTARRKLRDKGVRYIADCCRSLYHFATRAGLLPRDLPIPFSQVGLSRLRVRDAKPIFVFDAAQEEAFFRRADWWTFCIHFTAAKTGLRVGELTHLLVEDVDLAGGWLHVRGKPELGWVTKTNRERQVPLVPELVAVLRRVIDGRAAGVVFRRATLADAARDDGVTATALLPGDRAALGRAAQSRIGQARQARGRALTRREEAAALATVWRDAGAVPVDRLRTAFIRAAAAAGLPATCPKSWRHTFATLMQEASVDPLVRQETLGHRPVAPEMSALGMTGVYTHTTPELQRREIERALRLRPRSLVLPQALFPKEMSRTA